VKVNFKIRTIAFETLFCQQLAQVPCPTSFATKRVVHLESSVNFLPYNLTLLSKTRKCRTLLWLCMLLYAADTINLSSSMFYLANRKGTC